MIRLFVALTLPADVRRRLAALCSGVSGARWQRLDQFHLTLRFIGEVDEATGREIAEALDQVAITPFPLAIAGVGSFGDRRRPQVLWAGVRPEPELERLQGRIESTLQRAGLPAERRKYQPHVTLARLRDGHAGRVAEFLTGNGGFALPPFIVQGFTLYSSFLSHSGAIYRPEAEYGFDADWLDDEDGYDDGPVGEPQRPAAGW
jgi:2'-5' RNA ligase